MSVRLVWAQSRDGVIGVDGALPWRLPEDLRLFKSLTTGSTVVMGRRTWESLPAAVRPLPGRRNVVLSSTLAATDVDAEVAPSVDDVLAAHDDVWVIGGGEVYATFLPAADEIVVTEVDARVAGDTWAPGLDGGWRLGTRLPAAGWFASTGGMPFRVSWWHRDRAGAPASPVPGILADWSAGSGGPLGVDRFSA